MALYRFRDAEKLVCQLVDFCPMDFDGETKIDQKDLNLLIGVLHVLNSSTKNLKKASVF